MTFSFRKLPLTYKFLLAGIIPLLLLLYASKQLYLEKENRIALVANYINHIHESGEVASLISELAMEAKYSFEFAMKDGRYSNLVLQRSRTDQAIKNLESGDSSIFNFSKYTFLKGIEKIRAAQDASANYDVHSTMDFYNNAISRLSTINTVSPSNNAVLHPLYAQIESQQLIFEMMTLLAITRDKICLSLYTCYNLQGTLTTTHDAYNTLKTYEAEFQSKAPPSIRMFDASNNDQLRPVFAYLEYTLKNHQFDSTYTPAQWWNVSSKGINVLNEQYVLLRQQVQTGLNSIYQSEISDCNVTLIFLVAAITLVVGFIIYIVIAVHRVLNQLAAASKKTSTDNAGMHFSYLPKDVAAELLPLNKHTNKNGTEKGEGAPNNNGHHINEIKTEVNTVKAIPSRLASSPAGENSGNPQQHSDNHFFNKANGITKDAPKPGLHPEDRSADHNLKNDSDFAKPIGKVADADLRRSSSTDKFASKDEQRMDNLVNQKEPLIDASKIENGRLVYHRHIFPLHELVHQIAFETQKMTNFHKIFLGRTIPVKVNGDRERIAQVLSNLLQNSIKHCPGSENIIVSLEEKDQVAVCSVEDFGNGIIKEEQEKIFEKFYRINQTNADVHFGLGLYVAREIVKKHNGDIWVRSEPGLGSTFYFSLPIAGWCTENTI